MTPRYAFQRPPSHWRRWHFLAVGAAAGAGLVLAVAAARADSGPDRGFAEEACTVLRVGGSLDPNQPVDVIVRHGNELGAVKFRCPPDMPGRRLPAVAVTVVYP
jgi:hypothetical protein